MSHTVSMEDLEVRKFMRELQQKHSPLRADCLRALMSTQDEKRDAELKRVLKKHGYELLSMEKLVELLKNPPQNPTVPIHEDPETRPTVNLAVFAGVYQITSWPGSSITEITQLVVEDYCISWTENGSKKAFKPTVTEHSTIAFDGKESSEYQVEWGDKETEWFSVRFSTQFDASAKKLKQMFVGFRNTEGGMQLPFRGVRTHDAN